MKVSIVVGTLGVPLVFDLSSSKTGEMCSRFTPKELCHIAQGCRASRLPWVRFTTTESTPKGLRQYRSTIGTTPLG